MNARSLLDPLTAQFNGSSTTVTIKARIEVGSKRKFARFQLGLSCDVSSIKAKPKDTVLLTRLIYAEAADAPTDDERAAVGWSILNRKAAIKTHPKSTMASFGAKDDIGTVIAHVTSRGQVQYESYSKGMKQLERERASKQAEPRAQGWNQLDRPEQLNCSECAKLKKCAEIAEGILSGTIKGPYAAAGGTYFFHLDQNGVASGERKYNIVRLPKKPNYVHYFWTYDLSEQTQ
ncbi:hypothetical protein [Polyangium spumosum]|uniref:Uncharacterized protein n=1 Tax=Polyangium spumosum TaxID=889282 RepID=A0A6N7Q2W8_9BACT|nr:hypothetical protein [Polyangium spumosum]MRG98037.1 hypothetical protein [Polyangium spumosum]